MAGKKSRSSGRSRGGHGGRRAGAGRKAGALPEDLLKPFLDASGNLSPPLGKPLKLARWYTDILAVLSAARLRGESVSAIDKLAKEIRANATAAGKVIPHDIMFSAAAILKDDEDELAADGGPEEEELDASSAPDAAVRADGA